MTSHEQEALFKRLGDLKRVMSSRSINAVNLTELVAIMEDVVLSLPTTDKSASATTAAAYMSQPTGQREGR